MVVSYKKLWKLLIDRDMRKKDLQVAAGLSPSSMAKLSKNENVSISTFAAGNWEISLDVIGQGRHPVV